MFRILESQAPARQTAADTINTLSNRLQSATLLEDRRAAILGLRSFAKEYPASVASGGLRPLINSLRNDAEDVDTIKVVLETLLMLFSPDESSPEASDEIALWLADEFTQRQDNITILLDLLDAKEFYSRLYSLQLMSRISSARPERTQECIFTAPLGISRLVNVLSDSREPVRNEALLLLIALTPSSAELQKVVAFENAFELIFSIVEAEGSLTHGTMVVADCLSLLGNLLALNVSNQSYFRETGCVKRIATLLVAANQEEEIEGGLSEWLLEHRDKNLWGLLAIIQLFLIRGGVSTPVNQSAFWQNGVMEQVLRTAFNPSFNVTIKAKALATCADLIRGNSALQEQFADIDVAVGPKKNQEPFTNGASKTSTYETHNVIEALLGLTLESQSASFLDARLSACDCVKAFFSNHSGIRLHFLRRAIEGHNSGEDQIPNIFTILLQPPGSRGNTDPYQPWLAAVLLFHLVFEDTESKALAMKVTEGDASSGEEVITCVQAIAGNLISVMQRNDDERISVGYLMLLCGWLFEDPDVVNDFLGEGSIVQRLIQETKQNTSSKALLPGLSAVLLGIIYEFSTKDSPIPRATLHQLLTSGLGREQYIDKITKLRELSLVRDFEVLPRTAQGGYDGLPEVYFDTTFINFLKDNFSRLIRAIDRDPGFEVPIIANGIQKGISRELVDTLRAQVEDKSQVIQKLESDLLTLERKLEQERLDHRKTKDSTAVELGRIKHINETLQRNHEEEIRTLEERNKQSRNDLLRQHGEQLRDIDTQLKQKSAEYEKKASKIRERHEAEVADLKNTIQELKASLEKAGKDHIQDLQTAHEEYSSKLSSLEARNQRAEERTEECDERVAKAEKELKAAQAALEAAQAESKEREEARKAAQGELEDLLIVFSDLEAKRGQDKKRLKEFGVEVSEDEDGDDGEEEEDGVEKTIG
ncbi:intracellular protein transport protein [Paracoccidioides lutzii Pb01]|uniref:Intracellular protein transport protein n=1 Tax=Paracoccidioides lutzii (strain ATCC MYA-826 / Pb01) TaxID=502779 RepID=C1H8L3_PARBA|nr:intracellular protein transport protein [Paracoccidioides lutzii Pb01]EEH36686.2 intracellular protein transport protein [Paracoccidioides lutzii Pb01]